MYERQNVPGNSAQSKIKCPRNPISDTYLRPLNLQHLLYRLPIFLTQLTNTSSIHQ